MMSYERLSTAFSVTSNAVFARLKRQYGGRATRSTLAGRSIDRRSRAVANSRAVYGRRGSMRIWVKIGALVAAVLLQLLPTGPALAQKAGGILKLYHRDTPASMSILEEA